MSALPFNNAVGLGDVLRGLGSVLNPQVAQQVAEEQKGEEVMRRQMVLQALQQQALDQRAQQAQAHELEKARIAANAPKQFAPPELVQLQAYAQNLPEGDPRREAVAARISQLTTRPDRAESVSPLGRLIAEQNALPADLPQDHPIRKAYADAIAKQGQPGGVNVSVNPTIPISLGREASNKVDTGLLDTTQGLMRLATIEGQFRPEFQELGPRVAAEWTSWREKLGGNPSPEQRKFLTEYSAYKRNAINSMNEYIKSITGAAMSEAEAQRILRGMPNPGQGVFDGDSPTEFKAKMDDAIKQTKLSLARYEYIKRNGIALTDSTGNAVVPLERMPEIMNKRGSELEAQIRKATPNASAEIIQGQVRGLLAKEFGLVK